ncbi:MAG: guanylate kinase [Bradymonadia bacterium]
MVLLVISAASGTGKSTLARALLAKHEGLGFSVSHTTRAPRPGEIDGQHYHFVSRASFEETVEAGGFVEWAEYAGNLYGTAHSTIEQARVEGRDLLFEVEIIGAAKLKAAYPEAATVFILPPSWAALEDRLRGRQTEDEATVLRRLARAREEILAADSYDYLVLNAERAEAVTDLEHIYRAHQLRACPQHPLLEALKEG